jgi:hypothetical protein
VSSSDAALARSDFDVRAFVAKIEHFAPGWVAFHGKGAAVEVSRALGHGRVVHLGRQQWRVGSSRVFVLPSASGSNRSLAVGSVSDIDDRTATSRLIPHTRSGGRRRGENPALNHCHLAEASADILAAYPLTSSWRPTQLCTQ